MKTDKKTPKGVKSAREPTPPENDELAKRLLKGENGAGGSDGEKITPIVNPEKPTTPPRSAKMSNQ